MPFIRESGRIAAVVATLLLAGCATAGLETSDVATGSIQPSDERPQDEPVAKGKFHYAKGSYGLAERSFREAVEANSKSAEGWLGLAASYDRLRRFELAERAYTEVIKLEGRSVTVLNNLAYHHMLRGNLPKARSLLEEAAKQDPANPIVAGNFKLLETWKTGEPPPVQTVHR